jgi:hypothetical protein
MCITNSECAPIALIPGYAEVLGGLGVGYGFTLGCLAGKNLYDAVKDGPTILQSTCKRTHPALSREDLRPW